VSTLHERVARKRSKKDPSPSFLLLLVGEGLQVLGLSGEGKHQQQKFAYILYIHLSVHIYSLFPWWQKGGDRANEEEDKQKLAIHE
jgi:hypothetical protein